MISASNVMFKSLLGKLVHLDIVPEYLVNIQVSAAFICLNQEKSNLQICQNTCRYVKSAIKSDNKNNHFISVS